MAYSREVYEFICSNEGTSSFTHTTSEECAYKILKEGFEFWESLHYTADIPPRELRSIDFQLTMRKKFGDHLVVLELVCEIEDKYTAIVGTRNVTYAELLWTVDPRYDAEQGGLIYTMDHHYVEGIVNLKTGEIIKNESYDPRYDHPQFETNLDTLIQLRKDLHLTRV